MTNKLSSEPHLVWAFGEDYGQLPWPVLFVRWNINHSDIFEIQQDDVIWESLDRIKEVYEKHKEIKYMEER